MEGIKEILERLEKGIKLTEAEKIKKKRHNAMEWILSNYTISEVEANKLALEWVKFQHNKEIYTYEGLDIYGKKISKKLCNILDFMILKGYMRDKNENKSP